MQKMYKKAVKWLEAKVDPSRYPAPVVAVRRGYAEFIAYIYKIERPNRKGVWFIVEVDEQAITRIKRICLY